MNEVKFLKWLEEVVCEILVGFIVVDIGLDYVYLLCYIIINNIVIKVVVGEVVDGLFCFV